MKEKELPLHERSIADIYKNSSEVITYTIPIYQRNYAWTEDEITALIKMYMILARKIRMFLII